MIKLQNIVMPDSCEIILLSGNGTLQHISPGLEQLLRLSADQYKNRGQDEISHDGLKSLLTGKETITIQDEDGNPVNLLHTCVRQIPSPNDGFEVHLYQDQTSWLRLIQENETLKAENRELQLTDPVTNLMTRRAIHLVLEPQVSRCRRYNTPLSIVKLQFQYGDAAMDEKDLDDKALNISRILKDQLRWADLVGRTGTAEFLIILPETDQEAAESITDKLGTRIHELDNEYGVRFGVAGWKKGIDPEDLLYLADEALRSDSEEGKVA